jgi:DNA polymerase elongation subunit (family B)
MFIDIETVPVAARFEDMPMGLQEHWRKKSGTLKPSSSLVDQTPEALFQDKAGIYSEFAQVVCIGIGWLKKRDSGWKLLLKSFYDTDEPALLERLCASFSKFTKAQDGLVLCGHNIKEFDLPFLARRMLIRGQYLPECLNVQGKKPWEIPHIDTLERWKFGDYKNYTSLSLLAEVLGIPSPKDDIDGSQVGRVYWENGDLKRISDYCLKDVLTTARVYLRLSGEKDINPEPEYV